MNKMVRVSLAGLALAAVSVQAEMVAVSVTGEVEFNQVREGQFADVGSGDAVVIEFLVDSDDFLDSGSFNTRGYVVDQSSFWLTLGDVSVGLQDPFPAGLDPYFVLRNDDPAVDGFFLSTGPDFPSGLPVNEPAAFDPFFICMYDVGYTGETLSSLDILDAVGSYDFDGLTRFYFGILDGPFDAMGFVFEQMTISAAVPTEEISWSTVKELYR